MTKLLAPGEYAPWFRAATLEGNARFSFESVAGRYVVLLFAGSAAQAQTAEALRLMMSQRALFDDRRASFFGLTSDARDPVEGRIAKLMPGIRWFLDFDRKVADQFGATDGPEVYKPHWLLLDPMLRVIDRAAISDGARVLRQLTELLARPEPEGPAPVLIAPRVFEPAFCRHLIDLYEAHGGKISGFMREIDGVTQPAHDTSFKRRSDYDLDDHPDLRGEIRSRFERVLLPQIERGFQFKATRIERYVIACYDGDGEGGFFRPHRDNTTAGTSHRRFACSINLNAEDYEGGDLRFPEFGSRTYRPPTGGAVVFSCSLQHEATPVTRGKRYAYLPFFYDEVAALAREEIARSEKVTPELAQYRA